MPIRQTIIVEATHPFKHKAENYCAYQERSQSEVRQKLYEWGAYKNDVEQLIAQLIGDNYINEERFAKAYAGGKFRIKKWGRRKIIYGLKQKQISTYSINKGLQEIDEDDYKATLLKIIETKFANYKKASAIQKKKIAQFAAQRGFESELVWKILNEKS